MSHTVAHIELTAGCKPACTNFCVEGHALAGVIDDYIYVQCRAQAALEHTT